MEHVDLGGPQPTPLIGGKHDSDRLVDASMIDRKPRSDTWEPKIEKYPPSTHIEVVAYDLLDVLTGPSWHRVLDASHNANYRSATI